MRRLALLFLIILPVLCCAQQDLSAVQIKVTKLSGNVYMLQGAGGNMAALVGNDGILLVDTEFAPLGDKIRAALKELSDKPVRFVVNTHYHDDHTGGNAGLTKAATLIAQENVRKRLESGGLDGNGGSLRFEAKPAAKEALPTVTFDHETALYLDGEKVQIVHTPAAHTDGDAMVFFTKANVVHMGDDFVRYGFPFIDVYAGGTVQGMIAAMETALAKLPPDVKVIPGHGELATLDDVREYLSMLKGTTAAVERGMKAGKSLDQMKQEKLLAPWAKWSGGFISSDVFVETLYNSLKK